jgi:hypothetical protein
MPLTPTDAARMVIRRAWPDLSAHLRAILILSLRHLWHPLAIDIFAVNLLAAMLATHRPVTYGRRKDLLSVEPPRETQAAQLRLTASVFVIVLSIGISWVNTDAAKYCWLLLAVAPRIADRWSSRRPA